MINYNNLNTISDIEDACLKLEERLSKLICGEDSLDDVLKLEIMEDYKELKTILSPYLEEYGPHTALKKTNSEWLNIIKEQMNKENDRHYEIRFFDKKFVVKYDEYTGYKKRVTKHCIAVVADDFNIGKISGLDLIDHENSFEYLRNSDYVLYGVYSMDTDKYLQKNEYFRIRPGMPANLVNNVLDNNFKDNKEVIKQISLQKRI